VLKQSKLSIGRNNIHMSRSAQTAKPLNPKKVDTGVGVFKQSNFSIKRNNSHTSKIAQTAKPLSLTNNRQKIRSVQTVKPLNQQE